MERSQTSPQVMFGTLQHGTLIRGLARPGHGPNLNSLEIGAWLAGLGYSYAFCTSVLIQIRYNAPPNTPSTPSGSIKHAINKSQSYSTSATDPDGDNVKYRFNWNDGTPETETGFVASGQSASASHSWTAPGTYLVKAYTIDASGNASGWSSTLSVQVISPARSCYVITC
jgi:hypothetical protein